MKKLSKVEAETKRQFDKDAWEFKKDAAAVRKVAEPFLRKYYGPRCPARVSACPSCVVYVALDMLLDDPFNETAWPKPKKRSKCSSAKTVGKSRGRRKSRPA